MVAAAKSTPETAAATIWILYSSLEAQNSHIAFSPEGEMILDLEDVDRGQSVITERLLVMNTKIQTGQEELTL